MISATAAKLTTFANRYANHASLVWETIDNSPLTRNHLRTSTLYEYAEFPPDHGIPAGIPQPFTKEEFWHLVSEYRWNGFMIEFTTPTGVYPP